jgi:hypothetical protein
MSDSLNELGKDLKQTKDEARRYANKGSAEYPMGEIARDMYDHLVDYNMTFRTVRPGQSVSVNLQFELPPPSMGLGNCCGDCFCAMCEAFPSTDEDYATTLLLKRPYVAGSVRLMIDDFWWQDGITEYDSSAGIVKINSDIFNMGRDLTVCYVYAYPGCLSNEVDTPPVDDYGCSTDTEYFDQFTRPFEGTQPFGTYWDQTLGQPEYSECMDEWVTGEYYDFRGGAPVEMGWFLDGSHAVCAWNNYIDISNEAVAEAYLYNTTSELPFLGAWNLDCETEIKFKVSRVPTTRAGDASSKSLNWRIRIGTPGASFDFNCLITTYNPIGIYHKGMNGPDDLGTGDVSFEDISWTIDRWVYFKVKTLMDGSMEWKLWDETEVEPAYQHSYTGETAFPWTLEQLQAYDVDEGFIDFFVTTDDADIDAGVGSSYASYYLYVDHIKTTTPEGSEPPPPSGGGAEIPGGGETAPGSGTIYYIAATGSNTTGAGTLASPWRTIQKFLTVAGPGDTLYVRGGTYQGSDIGDIFSDNTKGTASERILVKAYPGETPVFLGGGTTPINHFWSFTERGAGTGSQYITVDGLHFSNWRVDDTGIFTSTARSTGLVHHIRWTNINVTMADNDQSRAHAFYAGANVHDLEVDHNVVDGRIDVYGVNHNGRGFQMYHEPGGYNIHVHHNFFKGWTAGTLLNDPYVHDVTIEHNTYINNHVNVQIELAAGNIVVRNNAGENSAGNIYDPNGSIDSESHNYWGAVGTVINTDGSLPVGSPAINGAHDGSDAGAF